MPLYATRDELATDWYDDDEQAGCSAWNDDIAGMYLRAEEAWPKGAAIRDAFPCTDDAGTGFPEDEPTDFDD